MPLAVGQGESALQRQERPSQPLRASRRYKGEETEPGLAGRGLVTPALLMARISPATKGGRRGVGNSGGKARKADWQCVEIGSTIVREMG
jgi:hypothetical protein